MKTSRQQHRRLARWAVVLLAVLDFLLWSSYSRTAPVPRRSSAVGYLSAPRT